MTTDSQIPPGQTIPPADAATTPPAPEAKLALDQFSDAMGDDIKAASPVADAGDGAVSNNAPGSLEAIYDIPVNITVVLGRTSIEVTDLLSLSEGDIVELDRKVGEAVDIFVNNRLVARGEVVLVEDRLGITMTEIIKGTQVA